MDKLLEKTLWIQQSDLFEKDPQLSENGRSLVINAVRMIAEEGLDGFTLKKLALECGITEPTVYRYFNNKISLCAYLCSLHWTWRQWQLVVATNNIKPGKKKLLKVAEILWEDLPESFILRGVKCSDLTTIIHREWNRLLHSKCQSGAITKSYEELRARIQTVVEEVSPNYSFSEEFSHMILEICFSFNPKMKSAKHGSNRHSFKFIKHLIEQL